MPNFYQNLEQLEEYLEKTLTIKQISETQISVNGYTVDTSVQLEMLSPAFFEGTSEDNPIIRDYKILFQNMGILPSNTPEIPLIRDIPLRTKTLNQPEKQYALFARFLEEDILSNQWTMLFVDEVNEIRNEIKLGIQTMRQPLATKTITIDEESGLPLTSGGYVVEQHNICGIKLWVHQPENQNNNKDIDAAVERTLNSTVNNHLIVDALKPKLLEKPKIAFNIRGISKSFLSRQDIQNNPLGGGHQHFLMLDRTTKTIYAINNTRGATDEDLLVFKQQIELFLKSLGDNTSYKFEFIQGKSRQPDDKQYLNQVCNISQFCHYAAILSGTKVTDLKDTVPAKSSTLMYLLHYASTFNDEKLYTILDTVIQGIFEQRVELPKLGQSPSLGRENRNHAKPKTIVPNSLSEVKAHFHNQINLIKVIERLEQGCKSYNPYWTNSQYKLDSIVKALDRCITERSDIDELLEDGSSELSKAINMRRLPHFNFFNTSDEDSPVKSREIINEMIT